MYTKKNYSNNNKKELVDTSASENMYKGRINEKIVCTRVIKAL